jgi:hypothetical protein
VKFYRLSSVPVRELDCTEKGTVMVASVSLLSLFVWREIGLRIGLSKKINPDPHLNAISCPKINYHLNISSQLNINSYLNIGPHSKAKSYLL